MSKEVHREIIGVSPDTNFCIIREIRAERVCITIVGAGGIRGLRNRYALEIGRSGNRKLREDPALCLLVEKHNRIARIVRGATPAAEPAPDCVPCGEARRRKYLCMRS